MSVYKDAMKKWVKDTGAGSGQEVNFMNWDEAKSWIDVEETKFQSFDKNRGKWLKSNNV